jgi:hypothetical protein
VNFNWAFITFTHSSPKVNLLNTSRGGSVRSFVSPEVLNGFFFKFSTGAYGEMCEMNLILVHID